MPDLGEEELRVELVDGLDVAEDGGDGLLGEEVLRPALLVHAELEHLRQKYSVTLYKKIIATRSFRLD